ncbi:hypothetical protein AKJ16_DCAP17868 [Drosera capensis]
MGYILRVRLASFCAGAATASFAGLYFLHKEYKLAHESISAQVKRLHDTLDQRISSLEHLKDQLKESEVSQPMEAAAAAE